MDSQESWYMTLQNTYSTYNNNELSLDINKSNAIHLIISQWDNFSNRHL